jgi:hypothetical protein
LLDSVNRSLDESVSLRTLTRCLKELLDSGDVSRQSGAGAKGNGHLYFLPER